MYARVKYERGWEMLPIDKVIHRLIKNTSKKLLEQRKEIEDLDRETDAIGTLRDTNLRITPQVFREVNEFKKGGISTDLETHVRTGLKLINS
jgi:hypothetical protein